MEVDRILKDSDELANLGWRDLALDLIANRWDFKETVEVEANDLADRVESGNLSAKDLHKAVRWANAYDRESTELLSEIDDQQIHQQDLVEYTARRLAHHAGRQALGLIGNKVKLQTYSARRYQRLAVRRNGISFSDSYYNR